MEAMVLVFVFLAIVGTCWMVVRDTGMAEEDDAEQEEYLKKWMEERKK